jgi:hypothetical protein
VLVDALGQQRQLGRREARVVVQQRGRARVRAIEDRRVVGQPREVEAREARLAGAGQLALAAQLKVDLGEGEAVRVPREGLQPQRVRRPEEQAQRRVLPAPHAPAQLV